MSELKKEEKANAKELKAREDHAKAYKNVVTVQDLFNKPTEATKVHKQVAKKEGK